MSGFGQGGFGSGPPNLPSFGGTPNPSPTQFGTGGGFGNAPSNFGAAPTSGFGTSPAAQPFGAGGFIGTTQAASTPAPPAFGGGSTSFGTSPNTAAFGASTSTSSFGATSTTPAFGTSATTAPFGSSATSTTPGFGQTSQPQATGFGTSSFGTPAPAPFSGGFGTSSTTSFGNTTSGFPPSSSTPAPASSPFGTSTSIAPTPSISFGVSSNVAPPTQAGFSNSSTPQASNLTGFGTSSTTAAPFGTSSTTAAPFGTSSTTAAPFGSSQTTAFGGTSSGFGAAQSDNEDMMDGGGNDVTASPFGASSTFPPKDVSLSPIAETSTQEEDTSMSPTPYTNEDSTMNADEARLAQLKAKIEAKKKKLEEKKRRKQAASPTRKPDVPQLNADAPSFVPGSSDQRALSSARSASRPSTAQHLPDDLKHRQQEAVRSVYKDSADNEADETVQDIENAESLVGTCPYMCPDDELLRRQNENDIQLLETPQPRTLHPNDWTLRDTAVKRYQRSAADYKLDVPEWVRPPGVLETVCGYLEEWVMERDRQGPDPRFPQSESPPPLDVYQFIWDRTRMVRKDFILQNYVGTGGKCDASAVRCHERIARWHAMMEHQLSHISEFVEHQSQQNINEFGQTMKTLNQYYDDSLGRSTVELPDEEGKETKADFKGATYGCSSEFVMGKQPVDYDGTPLNNDASSTNVSKRVIGPQAITSEARGTAEPEMRGLYILLTMDNDGGMEVLKYASHLSRTRPDVYQSKPVQLAMSIFQAKKEINYARFFSLLREKSTPYLFACIMFKYVEQMRKAAFQIMSKTYGARRRDNGEALYDVYPLKRLAQLLCFEDMDEARSACQHYNITVKEAQVSSSSSPTGKATVEVIYWRRSEFRQPKDPSKGFELRLKPRKMIRTIERKRMGATRLAVCRGEVSGDAASLSSIPDRSSKTLTRNDLVTPPPIEDSEARRREEEAARRLQEEQQRHMEELAAKRKLEERRRLAEEKRKKEEEMRRQEELKRQKEEDAKRQALLQKQIEAERKKAEDERRRQLEAEEAKRAAEAAAREELMRQEEEKRRAAEREAARRREEAAERERLLQEELRRKREEEERREQLRRQEEERKQREEEQRRLEQLRLLREREEQERRRREEEARRVAEAREAERNRARKLLIWKRLRNRFDRELRKERTRQSLRRFDFNCSRMETVVNLPSDIPDADAGNGRLVDRLMDTYSDVLPGMYTLDLLSRKSSPPLELSTMLRKAVHSVGRKPSSLGVPGDVVLVKMVVVLPAFVGTRADALRELVHMWLDRRLQFDRVLVDNLLSEGRTFEVRTVVSNGIGTGADYDMALFVVPPFFGDECLDQHGRIGFPQFDDNIPQAQAVLCLDTGANPKYADDVNMLLSSLPDARSFFVGEKMGDDVFERALEESCETLLENYVMASTEGLTRAGLLRLPISDLSFRCIRAALWRDVIQSGPTEEARIMNRAQATLMAMLAELDALFSDCKASMWQNWPAREFADEDGLVKDYFGKGIHLPLNWRKNLLRSEVEPTVMMLHDKLDGTLRTVIGNMIAEAPDDIKWDCDDLLRKRHFRRCFEYALAWKESENHSFADEAVVYLPAGSVRHVVESCVRRLGLEVEDDDSDLENVPDPVALTQQEHTSPTPTLRADALEVANLMSGSTAEPTPVAASRPLAQSFRTPESTTMTPPPVTTPATPAGVETPITRPSMSMNSVPKRNKRGLDSGSPSNLLQDAKRRKDDKKLSKNQRESKAFTKKLEALLNGETTLDMKVGNTSLSRLLRDAPDIQIPGSAKED